MRRWGRWIGVVVFLSVVACGGGGVEKGSNVIRVQGPGGHLRVSDGGAGDPAILFIHSLGGSLEQWEAQLEHFRESHRVVALDLRGHGESAPPEDGEYSLEALAADVGAVFGELGLGRTVVVGHSLGAGVAAVYAGGHPDRVAGLVLADPIGEQRRAEGEIREFVERLREGPYQEVIEEYWRSILTGAGPDVRDAVLADLRAAEPEAVMGGLEASLGFDPAAELERYGEPTLTIRTPMNDFPYSLHRVVEGIPTKILGETSHWLQMDRPEQFNAILEDFLGKVEAG